ncbi:MAG: lysine biosynthesis protein LysW, partial [Candidatus Methylomirabilales bacterium]
LPRVLCKGEGLPRERSGAGNEVAVIPRCVVTAEVMIMALCTECEAEIPLDPSTEIGEIIQCPDCGMDLEVLSVHPPELAPAPEEEEDWGE